MQRDRHAVARIWLRNAERDLEIAVELRERHPARACFHAQQAGEMALKAVLVERVDDHPRTHSTGALVLELRESGVEIPSQLAADVAALDLYYLTSRYPDSLGDADPYDVLGEADARRAIERAERTIDYARAAVPPAKS